MGYVLLFRFVCLSFTALLFVQFTSQRVPYSAVCLVFSQRTVPTKPLSVLVSSRDSSGQIVLSSELCNAVNETRSVTRPTVALAVCRRLRLGRLRRNRLRRADRQRSDARSDLSAGRRARIRRLSSSGFQRQGRSLRNSGIASAGNMRAADGGLRTCSVLGAGHRQSHAGRLTTEDGNIQDSSATVPRPGSDTGDNEVIEPARCQVWSAANQWRVFTGGNVVTVRHRRSQRCSGCTCTPQGGENFFSGLIYRKNVNVHPQPEQGSIFRTVFAWWLRFGGIFRRSLRGRRLKKGRQLFWGKSAPPDKILATPMHGAPRWDDFHKVWTYSTYPFLTYDAFAIPIPYVMMWTWPLTLWPFDLERS